MPCMGNSKDHCCYVKGEPCKYLEKDTVPGRIWACGLMRELQDWDKVINDSRYKEGPGAHFDTLGINCKDWPDKPAGVKCGECGYGCDT